MANKIVWIGLSIVGVILLVQIIAPAYFVSEEKTRMFDWQGAKWTAFSPQGYGTNTQPVGDRPDWTETIKSEVGGTALLSSASCYAFRPLSAGSDGAVAVSYLVLEEPLEGDVRNIRISDDMGSNTGDAANAVVGLYIYSNNEVQQSSPGAPLARISYLASSALKGINTDEKTAFTANFIKSDKYWTLQSGDRFDVVPAPTSGSYRLVLASSAQCLEASSTASASHSVKAMIVERFSDNAIVNPLPVPSPVRTSGDRAVLPFDPRGADLPVSDKLETITGRVFSRSFYTTIPGIVMLVGVLIMLYGLAVRK